MSSRLLVLVGVVAAFGALSAVALLDVGYLGIIEPHFQSWGGGQVFADLVILAVLAVLWMVKDARERELNAWPFVVITLFAGSLGPLFYLIARELRQTARRTASV